MLRLQHQLQRKSNLSFTQMTDYTVEFIYVHVIKSHCSKGLKHLFFLRFMQHETVFILQQQQQKS